MTSGPIFALKLRRENGISAWRTLMGPTNAEVAKKDFPKSIRALYGTDVQQNATHGSDSVKSAQRECAFYFETQNTLALIKPDSTKAGNDRAILHRIQSEGFKIVEMKRLQLTKEMAEGFYAEHKVLFILSLRKKYVANVHVCTCVLEIKCIKINRNVGFLMIW